MNHETEEHFKKSWRDTWYPQTKTVHIQACDVPVTFVSRSTSFGGIKWQISVTEDNYKLHFYVHGVGGEIFMTQMLQIKHVCTHTALKKCDLLLRVYVKLCFGASTCSSVSYFLIEKKKKLLLHGLPYWWVLYDTCCSGRLIRTACDIQNVLMKREPDVTGRKMFQEGWRNSELRHVQLLNHKGNSVQDQDHRSSPAADVNKIKQHIWFLLFKKTPK